MLKSMEVLDHFHLNSCYLGFPQCSIHYLDAVAKCYL